MSDFDNGYARAQRDYDNQSPPEDDRPECPQCGGSGNMIIALYQFQPNEYDCCDKCDGTGKMTDEQIAEQMDKEAEKKAETQAEAELERRDEYKEWCGND